MSYCYKGSFGALSGYLGVLQGYVGIGVMEYGQLDSGLGFKALGLAFLMV